MAGRTTRATIHFLKPFILPGFTRPNPPGDYRVDHDEDVIEGISRLAWHRTVSFIFLPAIGVQSATQQMVSISPADLDALLEKDKETP